MNRAFNHKHSGALRFILLLGLVSLCADVVYEGARSITGPFLFTLGASAAAVGWIAGLGEFLGYGLRLLTGFLADRLRSYWLFTFLGYAVSVLAIPLLALAGRWEIAAFFIILERMGKAVRTPARDVMLSSATKQVGRGRGFGLHEALDQVGAIAGPLFIALSLYLKNSFQVSFAWLLIPAIFTLGFLLLARLRFPVPLALELPSQRQPDSTRQRLPRVFWLYTVFIGFNMAGFAHFQLIAFHFKSQAIISDVMIPVFFAVAMGADALIALIIGRVYDRKGLLSLISAPLFCLPIPFLVFLGNNHLAVIGLLFWGMAMGVNGTIMRAAIADIVPIQARGSAYGIFNTVFGFAWFAGSGIMGILYGISFGYLIAFCIIMEVLSLLILPSLLIKVKQKVI